MRPKEAFTKPKQYFAAALVDKGLDSMEVAWRLEELNQQVSRVHFVSKSSEGV